MAGGRLAREGLRLLVFEFYSQFMSEELAAERTAKWSETAVAYRWMMFLDGEEGFKNLAKGRAGVPHAKVLEALAESGEFDEMELHFHRDRMRQFSEAMAMGGEGFVDAVHALGSGKGKPPTERKAGREGEDGTKPPKPGGWLRFLRGSKKEGV